MNGVALISSPVQFMGYTAFSPISPVRSASSDRFRTSRCPRRA